MLQDHESSAAPIDQAISPEAPLQPPPAPEFDVDAWFSQREMAIEQLQAHRESLLRAVEEAERRLRILGIEIPLGEEPELEPEEPPQGQTESGPKRSPTKRKMTPVLRALSQRDEVVLALVTHQPQKAAELAKRARYTYSTTWRALESLKAQGRVKSMGTPGKSLRWALTGKARKAA